MTVAYLLDRFPVRSQTFVRLEIDELRRQGEDVEVFALRGGDGTATTAPVTVLRDLPSDKTGHVLAHARAIVRSPRRYARFLRTVRQLRSERAELMVRRLPTIAERVVATGADRIHAHFAWSGAAVAMCLSELTGLPWSMTVHGNDVFGDRRNLDRKLQGAHEVVTVCDYMRAHLAGAHQVDAQVVVCGVEVPEEVVASADVDVVFVGRLVEKKGLDLLLEAVDPSWSVDVVGDGPLRAEMEDVVRRRGLDRVRFLGALDHDDTLDRIARGRVFCLPARIAGNGDRDSMPVVVKEALARAVPAVATAVAGIPEMVDATCGWLVPPDDVDALRSALHEALNDDDARAERGRAGRARVAERFTLAGEVARLREGALAR